MSWESRYLPPDPTLWQGRADIPEDACFYQHIRLINLLSEPLPTSEELAFAIVGFKCDEGTQRDLGRSGAAEGPIAIRHHLAKLPIQDPNLVCYDIGDMLCTDHDLESSQKALGDIIAILLEHHICPIVIGGGREAAWGHYQGIAKAYPPNKRLGIINVNPCLDLHSFSLSPGGSAATAFSQIAEAHDREKRHFDYNCIGIQHTANIRQMFEIAKQLNVHIILADELHQGLQEKCVDFIDRVIDENQLIYMSLSLDALSPAFAPGVGSIQPLGLYPWHVIPLIRQIAASGKVISYDIVDLVPHYDIDHRTAKLAASLVYEIIHHHYKHR